METLFSPTMCATMCFVSVTSEAVGFLAIMSNDNIGVGCVGFDMSGIMCFSIQLSWPSKMLPAFDQKKPVLVAKTHHCLILVKECHVILKKEYLVCSYCRENEKILKIMCILQF
jgi:hypothetical protein